LAPSLAGAEEAVAPADANVAWLLVMEIHEGRLEDFRALMQEMVAATHADEPGTLNYEWYIDGRTLHLFEKYRDDDAVMVHMRNFGERFAERFMGWATPQSINVYGPASQAVRDAFTPMGGVFLERFGGFAR
jgi:quinol monooxygenase YgiN